MDDLGEPMLAKFPRDIADICDSTEFEIFGVSKTAQRIRGGETKGLTMES